MKKTDSVLFALAATLVLACVPAMAAAPTPRPTPIPQTDSSYIDASGTAHITRVVPVPKTVSPEAQKYLARPMSDAPWKTSLQENRREAAASQAAAEKELLRLYPARVVNGQTVAGVPVRLVTPLHMPRRNRDRVLINLHGGGFVLDSGSLFESIPIASLTQTKVISVLYRLAPEHPFPAAVEDAVAVYKELLKTYKPQNIGIYGTSAGAILTPEVTVRLRQLGLPLPGALGVFSGTGDFSKRGDSQAIYGLAGLSGYIAPPTDRRSEGAYFGSTNLKDPVLSPFYADLRGFPPTLFVTSGRDMLLSGTTILHRAFLRAGVDARLIVFEGLPHAFWYNSALPESREANGDMAAFFEKELHLAGASTRP